MQSKLTAKISKKSVAILATSLLGAGLFASAVTASADQVKYTVQSGDTLSHISNKFYNDQSHFQSIAQSNNIGNIGLIYVGQTLTIDTNASTATAATVQSTPAPATTATVSAPATTASITTNNGHTANSAKEAIAMTESGGSYTAQNGQYYGRYQLTSSYLGGDLSEANQERVADKYVAERYGSWEAAWQFHLSHGWY